MEEYINVGVFLFSQAASSQLSSALLSLTSVFGMGTGGPSASSTPTIFFLFCRLSQRQDRLYHPFLKNASVFSKKIKKFLKNFENPIK